MKPGFYTNLTNAEYHGGEGVSKSFLDIVEKSPLHAKAALDKANDDDREPSAAYVIGTAFHTLLLEPDKFADEYVCELTRDDAPHTIGERETLVAMVEELNASRLPKLSTSGTKDEQIARIETAYAEHPAPFAHVPFDTLCGMPGKELKAELDRLNAARPGKLSTSGSMTELAAILAANGKPVTLWQDVRARWNEENEGYTVLAADTFEQLLAMRDAVMAHPAARMLLTGCPGIAEASIYATDPATGELRRVRPDFLRMDGVVVDLKTTIDASPEGFAKSIAAYGYHRQDPYYQDTIRLAARAGHLPEGYAFPKSFVFLAVEKAFPHAIGCYVLDEDSRILGRTQCTNALQTLAKCRASGEWPGYGDTLQAIGVPQYYLTRHAHLVGAA